MGDSLAFEGTEAELQAARIRTCGNSCGTAAPKHLWREQAKPNGRNSKSDLLAIGALIILGFLVFLMAG